MDLIDESLEPFNDCNPIFIDEIICATLLPTIEADIPATFTILFITFVITDAINNDLVPYITFVFRLLLLIMYI